MIMDFDTRRGVSNNPGHSPCHGAKMDMIALNDTFGRSDNEQETCSRMRQTLNGAEVLKSKPRVASGAQKPAPTLRLSESSSRWNQLGHFWQHEPTFLEQSKEVSGAISTPPELSTPNSSADPNAVHFRRIAHASLFSASLFSCRVHYYCFRGLDAGPGKPVCSTYVSMKKILLMSFVALV